MIQTDRKVGCIYQNIDFTYRLILVLLFFFTKLSFHFFQSEIFLNFCISGPTKWIFFNLVLIVSKFGMYLTYKNWFWDHFSWFLGRRIYSTVWTRNGSKIDFQVLVFKGLNVKRKYLQSVQLHTVYHTLTRCVFLRLQA